jgi:hypothetical protein
VTRGKTVMLRRETPTPTVLKVGWVWGVRHFDLMAIAKVLNSMILRQFYRVKHEETSNDVT